MAAHTPRAARKLKNNNYLDAVGKKGRVTGIEVPEHERNEEDMEDPRDFFSSTGKTLTARSTRTATAKRKSEATDSSSEDMEIQQSSGPSVTDALSVGQSTRRKPPPASRSPIRTNLGATPKRPSSVGASTRPSLTTTSKRSSLGPTERRLFNDNTASPSGARVNSDRSPQVSGETGRVRRDIYSLSPSKSPRPQGSLRNRLVGGNARKEDAVDQDDEVVNGMFDEGEMPGPAAIEDDYDVNDDPMNTTEQDPVADLAGEQLQEESASATKGNGRTRKSRAARTSGASNPSVNEISQVEEPSQPEPEPEAEQSDGAANESEAAAKPSKKRRGRPKKSDTLSKQPSGKASKQNYVLAKKDTNSKTKRRTQPSKHDTEGFKKPGIPHGLQRERHETPFEESDAAPLRSGRVSYKPLAFWKGERVIWKPHAPLEIEELVRMEDVTPQKRLHSRAGSVQPARRRRKRKFSVFQDEEEDEEDFAEPWETDTGIVSGRVQVWDPVLSTGKNERKDQEIAFSSGRIVARDVADADFRYAKTITLPFFGSGMVELPPGGFKRSKNSRKMQMVFFVHYGKVAVEVAGTSFIITKGGVWQVPRGNFYSIENATAKPAKIFFSQGCEVVSSEGVAGSGSGGALPEANGA